MKNKIKLLFAGDFCSEFPNKIELSDSIRNLFNSCDIQLLNFEGPLAKGKLNIPNNTVLPQSSNSPNWCEEVGFNIVSLSNNHSLDYSAEGLLETKKKFENSTTLGVGDWEEAHGVKFVDIDGIRLGFIAGTSCDFSALKDKWTDFNKTGCAWINSSEINNQIRENKDKCDYLFVIAHGGLEYMDIPLPEWRDRYRELIDLGVDGVIGGHPHVPQGVEIYKKKPIFYSLGNFYFDNFKINKPDFWDNGIFAVIEIENNIITQKTIPTIRKGHLIDIDASKETEQHLLDISSVLTDDNRYMQQVNKEVLRLYPKYESWLLCGFNALEVKFNLRSLYRILKRVLLFRSKPNYKIAMHQLREDSTRWALSRALKLMSKSDL